MKKISIGIIGCSNVARHRFIPSLKESRVANLKIIGSRSIQKAENWAKEFCCSNFGSYDDVLNSDVEIVYISTPIGLHEKWVIKAANAGKHIICEKSSTNSYKSAKKIIEACEKNKIRIIENFSFKFHPQHEKICKLIKNEFVGKLSSFSGVFTIPIPQKSDIRWNKKLGGGILNDVTCYPIYASRMIFHSEPIGVFGHAEYDKISNIDIKSNVLLKYASNLSAVVFGSYENYYQSKYTILGSHGLIHSTRAYSIPKNSRTKILLEKNEKTKTIEVLSANQFQLLIDTFCKTIIDKNKINDESFEKDLLAQARVMEAIRCSCKENRFILLNEIE